MVAAFQVRQYFPQLQLNILVNRHNVCEVCGGEEKAENAIVCAENMKDTEYGNGVDNIDQPEE